MRRTKQHRIVLAHSYIWAHALCYAGYAIFGKGFAYIGSGTFYVGEALLLFGVIVLTRMKRLAPLLKTPLGAVFVCFFAWQSACTVQSFGAYDWKLVLRDGAAWGYSMFALIAGAILLRVPRGVEMVTRAFRSFSRVYLVVAPFALLATTYLSGHLPVIPGTAVSIPTMKADDYATHISGIFFGTALSNGGSGWLFLAAADLTLAMYHRGALVAFLASLTCVTFLVPRIGKLFTALASVAMVGAVFLLSGIQISFPTAQGRDFLSAQQLSAELGSLTGTVQNPDMEATKQWRENWWAKIWEYTVQGPYFLMGKGYGINLADDDGFQTDNVLHDLRNPHSAHLMFLARSGVPGFVLWILLQFTWAYTMFRSQRRARILKSGSWSRFFTWILGYWVAFVVTASFDVFFEGPTAAIPFWTVFGVGWASSILFSSSLGPDRARSIHRLGRELGEPLQRALAFRSVDQ